MGTVDHGTGDLFHTHDGALAGHNVQQPIQLGFNFLFVTLLVSDNIVHIIPESADFLNSSLLIQ